MAVEKTGNDWTAPSGRNEVKDGLGRGFHVSRGMPA